ncbi:MAG: 50S ribosomal protein L3 [Thaumarchaeota archaeon]|nr:50S ribosomal protein L3 [Nitrososphaerota archaeon]
MGHRKHSAPRRGSLAYSPRGRAKRFVPKIRTWPKIESPTPMLLGFPTFKAGTIHAITIDDREKTPNFGKPLFNPATVLAAPEAEVVGVRLYRREWGADWAMTETHAPDGKSGSKRGKGAPRSLEAWKEKLGGVARITGIVSVTPKDVGLSQKNPIKFEMGVGGGDIKSQFDYLTSLIGKRVKFSEIFKPGMYVDVLGITKGKGFEGPVTRFGVKRKQHKSRKSVRAVGVIGPWHPAAVMYTVPRAGQKGFQQRTESGKRILLIGNGKEKPITPAGGFLHFGNVNGDYAVLKGSVPGSPRRFVLVRYAARPKVRKIAPPQVVQISPGLGA